MYLDAYFPIANLALEVDGPHHYKFIPYYHVTEAEFAASKQRDLDKDRLLTEHGIRLLRIGYNEPRTTERLLILIAAATASV
jgi:hypothetical protein